MARLNDYVRGVLQAEVDLGLDADALWQVECSRRASVLPYCESISARIRAGALSSFEGSQVAFMAGIVAGLRLSRETVDGTSVMAARGNMKAVSAQYEALPPDERGSLAGTYVDLLLEEERALGAPRSTLAEQECAQYPGAAEALRWAAERVVNPEELAVFVFRLGLVAGFRASRGEQLEPTVERPAQSSELGPYHEETGAAAPKDRRKRVQESAANVGGGVGFVLAIIGIIGVAVEGGGPGFWIRNSIILVGAFTLGGLAIGWVIGLVISSLVPPEEMERR